MLQLPTNFSFLFIFLIGLCWRNGKCVEIPGCFPSSPHNRTEIKCSLHTHFEVETECPIKEQNVIRFHGEFGALIINCTAPFHLDLDYDGFRPTEAVELSIWKNLDVQDGNQNVKIAVTAFGLTVTIRSIRNLFDYTQEYRTTASTEQIFHNQNLKSPIIYPRSGKFKIRGLHEKNKEIFQEFYFFFEEPLLENEISFIDNEYTLKPRWISGNETAPSILIPCRPSHWTKNVSLEYRRKPARNESEEKHAEKFTLVSQEFALFDPTVGFKVPALNLNMTNAEDLKTFEIQCSAISLTGKTVVWKADTKVEEMSGDFVFGRHRLTEIQNTENLRIENHVKITSDDNYSLLRCFLDRPPQSNDAFYSFGRPLGTMLELRYNREIILPMFVNRSYWAQRWEVSPEIRDIFITRANPHGVIFCRKNHTYIYQQYTSGLNLKEIKKEINTTWENFPGRTTGMEFQIKIEMIEPANRAKLYPHFKYLFHCHSSGFSFTKPILWFFKFKNETEVLVFKDDNLSSPISKLTTRLTSQVEQVFCVKFLWDGFDELGGIQKRFWKTAYTNNLNIQDGRGPTITSKQDVIYFPLDSTDQRITCEATGDPTPSVWWWQRNKQNLRIVGGNVAGRASFEIPLIDEKSLGVYICKASNDYGIAEMEFKVMASPRGASFYILAVGLPIFIIIFIIVVAFLFFNYRRQLKRTRLTIQELKEFREGMDPGKNAHVEKDLLPLSQPYKKDLFEIPEGDFIIDEKRVLGSGAFGLVLCASINGRQVAVKTTKPGADKSFLKSLLSELKILMYLGDHPHLINLVGASTAHLDKGTVFVFVELCEGGDLLSFLQKHGEKFINHIYKNVKEMDELEYKIEQLHSWAIQIAKGMDYLTNKKVIHGDLAARNVLLTSEKTAKITDLGLSRQLYACAVYQKKSKDPLPFRWMALEALEDLKFSSESDRWAFGVLLWEMYSLGQVPYPTFGWNPQFIQHLKSGHRLSCPPLLPRRIFSAILMPCWEIIPERRPDFSTLSATLEKMTQKSKKEETSPTGLNYVNALPDLSPTTHAVPSTLNHQPISLSSKQEERYTMEPKTTTNTSGHEQQKEVTIYQNQLSDEHQDPGIKKKFQRAPTMSEIYEHPLPIKKEKFDLYANISEALEQTFSSDYMNNHPQTQTQEKTENYANSETSQISQLNENPKDEAGVNYQNESTSRHDKSKTLAVELEQFEMQLNYMNVPNSGTKSIIK